MTQRGVENTRVHFWTFSPVSVNTLKELKIFFRELDIIDYFIVRWYLRCYFTASVDVNYNVFKLNDFYVSVNLKFCNVEIFER